MNAGIHKLTAGGGYLYLIRQVAANDATHRGRPSLSDYYSQKGESPGRWMGRGLAALGQPVGRELLTDKARDIWNVQAGSVVTEDQMRALFGLGLHPNAAAIAEHLISQGAPKAAGLAAGKLGRPFQIRDGATELQRRVAVALRDHNLIRGQHWSAPVEDEVAAPIRTKIARELFAAEYGREPSDDRELSGYIARESREPTTSVAGYDLRFTPVKSVSVLWALAPLDVARVIEECHEHAVTDALDHLQEHAAFTRTGNGGVAQIDTEGFIAAAFMHRDSRAGDPHLHTHVPISNKVRGVGADGIPRWLALDGRPLFKATVAASELYNTRLEAYLIEALGLVFAEREQREDRGKRPVREVVGIGVELIDLFSSSLRAIETRYAELAAQFHAREGREPTLKESIDLYERAHLDTRKAKHEPRSLAEQRSQWKDQAVQLLGGVAELTELLGSVLTGHRQASQELTQQWVDGQAALVVETVAATRSIWQRTHVFAEAQRRVRETDAHASMRVAERITDAALAQHSIAYARDLDADLGEPEALRRRDGSSVYTTHGTHLYTSAAVVSAERRILAAAQLGDGRCVGEQAVSLALLEAHANGRTLNPGQHALVRHMACSGARVSLALAPPGTGKTTAMATLAQAWQEEGGHVVGLASSANAARLLRDDMARQGVAIDADTVDKLVWLTHNPDAREDPARSWFDRIGNRTLIIVDEAGKSGTLKLDAVIRHALARGASVRLIGDDKQLSSIEAGGILTDIAHSAGAVTLTEVMRFASRAEAAAMLALRDGDPAGLAFYADNHRIHVASDQTAADMAFDRWQEDLAKGWDSQLLAPTNETVKALNRRAQVQYLGTDNRQAAHTELSDGLQASVGDIISTRKNARTLRIGGGRDFVRNGYRWTVTKVHRSGALTATQVGSRRKVTLPTWYVTEHTTLGYASTIDAIQGDTIGDRNRPGTCHVVGCDTLTRQHITTSMSRARTENHIYLSTAETDPHRILSPKATHPETAIDVLTRAVGRDAAQVSATTAQRQAEDPFRRLGPGAARYLDAVGAGAEHQVDPAVLQRIDTHADTIYPELTQSGAWPVLRRHLAIIALAGDDPVERLREAAGRSELDTAADCAAVLDWRLDYSGAHSAGIGPLRWLPDIPAALDQHPAWGEYLRGRRDLVAGLADEIRDTANEWTQRSAPTWARGLLSKPKLVAEIAVFRAATGVEDADSRVTGPEQYPVRARKIQRLLEGAAQQITGPADDYRRFNDLIDRIDPRIRRDQYWTPLAASLATIGRTGVDVGQLLSEVAAQRPLPDEMPAAALWWRLSGTLTPAAVQTNSTRLRPDWMRDLHAVCGSALTETIAADPAFPGLVAAVGAADPARWTPRELLELAFEHLRDVDQTLRPDECARLLTYTIDLFASEHPFDRDIPLPDEPMSAQEEEELAETGVYVIPEQFDQHIGEELPSQSVIGVNPDHLTFEDLSTDRPTLPSISADVYGLRDAHERARADLAAASTRTATGLHIPDISDDTDTLTGALACAAAGFYILPVRRGTKHPGSVIGKGWHTKSSRDPKVIAAWFAGTDHDIAIHCGRSGALAFDVDYPEKLTDLLAAHLLDPAVPYHSTRPDQPGRGHYLFAMPPGRIIGNSTGRLAAGWGEVRGANGVIIVAPCSDGRRRWVRGGALPVLPDELAAALDDALTAEASATDDAVKAFISEHTKATRPQLTYGWISMLRAQIAAGESRNFTTTKVVAGACKEARAGYIDAATTLDALKAIFLQAVAKPAASGKQGAARTGKAALSEWNRIVAWAIGQANAADLDAVAARVDAKVVCEQARHDLNRAEGEAARAFAEAQTRNADHIIARRDELTTEFAVLQAAGGRTLRGGITLPPATTKDLDRLSLVAGIDRTVTAVRTGHDDQTLKVMSVLYAAADGRKVMWCTTPELVEPARRAEVADTVIAVADAHQRFTDGRWRMPADSIVVVDHAADIQPTVIADLARHAGENRARMLLLDPGEQSRPAKPSSALLALLHHDLPWSVILTTAPARRVHQSDLDSVLEQAARFDRSLLPGDIVGALDERRWMRHDRAKTHQIEQHGLWHERTRGRDHSLGGGLQL